MKNKKGSFIGILFVVGGLFLLLMLGIMLAIGSSTINWVMDEAVPELSELGMVGDANATFITDVAIDPVNTFIQNMTWVSGVLYVLGLFGVFGLAFVFRETGDKWLIGLFLAVVLILIIGCLIMSNIYEEIYNDGSELGGILKEHIVLSFLILYSPGIMSILAFVAGIILFSGDSGGNV